MTARSHSRSRRKQKRKDAIGAIKAERERRLLKPRKVRRQQVGYVVVREQSGPVRYNEDDYFRSLTKAGT